MPTYDDFIDEINRLKTEAKKANKEYVDITSKDVHIKLGGYPGGNHRMSSCCTAMYDSMKTRDEVLSAPPKGKGATLKIRYYL